MLAMLQQADAVYLLTSGWGSQAARIGIDDDERATGETWMRSRASIKFNELCEQANKKLADENAERAQRGQPPKVLKVDRRSLVHYYFPDAEQPFQTFACWYTPKDFAEAFNVFKSQHMASAVRLRPGISKEVTPKADFSFNVIHFVKEGEGPRPCL